MSAFSTAKRRVIWGACGLLCCVFGAVVVSAEQEPGAKKAGQKKTPPAAARQVNIDAARFKINQPLAPIAHKPFDLAEMRVLWKNADLTLTSMVTLPNKKKITVQACMDQYNQIEKAANPAGYSLRNWPKGGVKMSLTSTGTAASMAKQKAALVAARHKASPAKQKLVDAFDAAKPSKITLAASQKNQEELTKHRQTDLAKRLKAIDPKKLSAAEKHIYDQISPSKPADKTLLSDVAKARANPTLALGALQGVLVHIQTTITRPGIGLWAARTWRRSTSRATWRLPANTPF